MNQKKVTRMKKLLSGFSDYVGTKKSYCERHQIKPHVFDYWRKKLCPVLEASVSDVPSRFVPLSLKPSKVSDYLELYYENGRSIRISSATPVSLIEQLLKLQIDV